MADEGVVERTVVEPINWLIRLDRLEDGLQLTKILENNFVKVRTLLQIARKFESQRQQPEQAFDIWMQALTVAQLMVDATSRAKAIAHVVDTSDRCKCFQKPEIAAKILRALQALPDDYAKFDALFSYRCIDQALQTVQKLEGGYPKVDALIKIALKRASHGQPDQAFELWQQAIETAQAISHIDDREKALLLVVQSVNCATSYTQLTNPLFGLETQSEWAAEAYTQAIQIAQSFNHIEYKNTAINSLVRRLVADQKTDQAIQLINQNNVIVSLKQHPWEPAASAFYQWINQAGMPEAYCFTALPSFKSQVILRVWCQENPSPGWHAAVQGREERWELTLRESSKLLAAIEESQFWNSVTWDVRQGFDGTSCIFEGWRAGQYQCLRAWQPEDGAPYRLSLAFTELLREQFD